MVMVHHLAILDTGMSTICKLMLQPSIQMIAIVIHTLEGDL